MRLIAFILGGLLILCSCGGEQPPDINRGASSVDQIPIDSSELLSEVADSNSNLLDTSDIEFPEGMSEEDKKRIMDKITKEYLMGKINPETDERFAKIPQGYTNKKSAMYMRKEALAAFEKMREAAKKEGIPLTIVSATRPFNAQKSIWEAKWTGQRKVDGKLLPKEVKDAKARALKILRWSSMPSTSRHHWGTDIDINSTEPAYFDKSPGKEQYEWLTTHGPEYGFCQVYSPIGENEARQYGYQEEKWHWSYLPVALELTLEYGKQITDKDISGFLGSEAAPDIEVVKKYVLGVNPQCLQEQKK